MPSSDKIRLLLLVAHPDDAEARCGGIMTAYRNAGHDVKWISVTNGNAGHHEISGAELTGVRTQESANASQVIGAEYEVWDTPDGCLEATLEMRWKIIRAIRSYQPDLVLTHRTCDYHPDHRAVGQLVQDASFSVTVPALVPDTPALRKDPVIAYMADLFTRPNSLRPDIIVNADPFADTIIEMFSCHASQVFQWLPYNLGVNDPVPDNVEDRNAWVRKHFMKQLYGGVADKFRDSLTDIYGGETAADIEFAEVYEISEYAGEMDGELRKRLFDFVVHPEKT